MHKDGTPVITQKVSVDSVVFSDGEFAGPDTVHIFDYVSMRVDATREFALSALGDMTQIETRAKAYHGLPLKGELELRLKKSWHRR